MISTKSSAIISRYFTTTIHQSSFKNTNSKRTCLFHHLSPKKNEAVYRSKPVPTSDQDALTLAVEFMEQHLMNFLNWDPVNRDRTKGAIQAGHSKELVTGSLGLFGCVFFSYFYIFLQYVFFFPAIGKSETITFVFGCFFDVLSKSKETVRISRAKIDILSVP